MQASAAPVVLDETQRALDRRHQGVYGPGAMGDVVEQRRNPIETASHQLEVVMQSGVQWFREA